MTTLTLAEIMDPTTISRPTHLPSDLEIPILAGVQFQGDVAVLPVDVAEANGVTVHPDAEFRPVPQQGLVVVRGEQGGNTHLLVADPNVCTVSDGFDDPTGLGLAVVDVAAPGAYLIHPEHGANGIAPGRYVFRRQREQTAAGMRIVAD